MLIFKIVKCLGGKRRNKEFLKDIKFDETKKVYYFPYTICGTTLNYFTL